MLIGLTGYARSGKDTVANYLVEQFGYVRMAFADGVREMALALDPYVDCGQDAHFTEGNTPFARYTELLKARGYEAAKACPDVRRFLQRLGTEAVRGVVGDSVWRDIVAKKIAESENQNIVITDVRFQNEAIFIKEMGGIVVRLVRPGFGRQTGHASETEMEAWLEDVCIEASSVEELQVEVFGLMDRIARGDYAPYPVFLPNELWQPRVYLAAPWACKEAAQLAKAALQSAGLNVVSTWTEQPDEDAPGLTDKVRRAVSDWSELRSADAFVLLSLERSSGKETEMGGAVMAGKRVIVVGDEGGNNVFYNLPEVERVDTLNEAIVLLGGTPRETPAPTGGFERTLDPVTGQPLPGSPWDGLPVESVPALDEHDLHDLARHAGESGKD
jgi:hypothetical protein